MEELDKREDRYRELQDVSEVREIERDEKEAEDELSIEQPRLDELENL